MSRKISEIYTEYKIISNLQNHMLRVAAVASIICDNFNEPLPKDAIITACLLHDVGNIIKFRMDHFVEYFEPEGVEYWQKVKDEYLEKYGEDDHAASVDIAKEIGISKESIDYLDAIGFTYCTNNERESVFGYKICNYSDMRVGPHGVLLMEKRLSEAHKRYEGRIHDIAQIDTFEPLSQSARNIEKQIFSKCKIKPEDITDEAVAHIIESLKDFVIK